MESNNVHIVLSPRTQICICIGAAFTIGIACYIGQLAGTARVVEATKVLTETITNIAKETRG